MIAEELLFTEYKGKRVLLDANLLLLYFVGSFERERIARFKRTDKYSTIEFDILVQLMTAFRVIVTTPHLLTEVSNLANSLPEHLKPTWSEHFALQAAKLLEVFEPAASVMGFSSFSLFGLADAALHQAARDTLVLTDDFRLSSYLRSEGVAVINFRDLAPFL